MRSKTFRQLIWLLALMSQIWQTDHFFTYSGPDRNLQMLATKSYLETGDWCIPQQTDSGASCETLTGWPPAFAVLIGAFYQLSGDWFLAARWFNAIGVLLVFIAMHFLLLKLDPWLSDKVYPLLFLFWGISFTPFYYTFGIEEWALASFLLASIASISLWQSVRWHWAWWLLLAFSIGLGLSMRYAYAPLGVLLLMPIMMGRFKERQWRLQAALSGLGLIAFGISITLLLSPTTIDGDRWYELLQTNDLYLESLLHFDAFPLKAWVYFSLDGVSNKLTSIPFGGLVLVKIALVCASFILLFSLWRSFRTIPSRSSFRYIQASWWAVIICMVLFLTMLSVVKAPELNDGQWYWTSVKETRYYVPLMVIIQLLSLHAVFGRSPKEQSQWHHKISITLLILAFAYSGLHTGYRLFGADAKGTRYTATEQRMIDTYVEIEKLSSKGKTIWWQSGKMIAEQDLASIAALAGASIIPFGQSPLFIPSENADTLILPRPQVED